MLEELKEKEISINNKIIGVNSIVKLNIKTAFWLVSLVFGLIMTILSYAYFDLKSNIKTQQIEYTKSINEKVENIEKEVVNIRLIQENIKGDIKIILDRQSRDNPIKPTNFKLSTIIPPLLIQDTIIKN